MWRDEHFDPWVLAEVKCLWPSVTIGGETFHQCSQSPVDGRRSGNQPVVTAPPESAAPLKQLIQIVGRIDDMTSGIQRQPSHLQPVKSLARDWKSEIVHCSSAAWLRRAICRCGARQSAMRWWLNRYFFRPNTSSHRSSPPGSVTRMARSCLKGSGCSASGWDINPPCLSKFQQLVLRIDAIGAHRPKRNDIPDSPAPSGNMLSSSTIALPADSSMMRSSSEG